VRRSDLVYALRKDLAERAWSIADELEQSYDLRVVAARLSALACFTDDLLHIVRSVLAREQARRDETGEESTKL